VTRQQLRRCVRPFIVTATVAATVMAVLSVSPANAATPSGSPVGSLDIATGGTGVVSVVGWLDDPSSSSTSIRGTVTVGGTTVGSLSAKYSRPDVNRVKHVSGKHGYTGVLATTKTGRQSVCVVAVNIGAGASRSVGCKTVTIASPDPVSGYDSAVGGKGAVTVSGWSYDPSNKAASNTVSVSVGGTTVGAIKASGSRPDVDRAKGISGDHGYTGTLQTTKTGAQSVCVTAINMGVGKNVSAGCRTVTITPATSSQSSATAPTVPPVASAPSSSGSTSTGDDDPSSPSGEAMPVGDVTSNGRTWQQFYKQDFTTAAPLGTVLSKYTDLGAYNGFNDTSGKGLYAPSKVLSVSGGVLDFNLHTENGQPLVSTVIPDNYAPMTTGRVSIRYKTTATPGYKFVGILWPEDNNWNEGEVDWPEADLGGTPRPASATPGSYTNGNMLFAPGREIFASSNTTSWHTATTEWDHGILRFYWDGQLVTSITNAVPTTPFRMTLQAETWIGEGAVPASSVGHVDIDWISMWK
jgi:hypothetical protein